MKSKKIFKWGSKACLILFYIILLAGVFIVMDHVGHLWFPGSEFVQFFGGFEPVFSYTDLNFDQAPALYSDPSYIAISLLSSATMLVSFLFFLWYIHKLLGNIHAHSLFMVENVAILYKLGFTTIIFETIYTFTEGLLLSRAVNELVITNGRIVLTDLSYIESIESGLIIMIIASALKVAVRALEEKKVQFNS